MIRLPTAAITALRDRLRDRGQRPSISVPTAAEDLLDELIAEHYGPLCEAMYLMMAADQQITGAERDVIRGALRELDDRIRSRHVESMLATSAEALVRDGWVLRLSAIGEALEGDRARAEAAVLLAAAVAYADGEIASAENDVMLQLLEVLHVPHERMLALIASLERVDTVLERDAKVDAADVVVHAALRLRTPEDFERLAATSDRPDVSLVLRLYAAFVRTGDDLLDSGAPPRSIATASVSALRSFAEGLQEGRSERLDEIRAAIVELTTALDRIDHASSLRALLVGDAVRSLEDSLDRLSQFIVRALERLGDAVSATSVPRDLRRAIDDAARGPRGGLEAAIDRLLAWSAPTIPSAIAATISIVLQKVIGLPAESASEPPASEVADLPDWIPASRTLAGWYVHRQLGGGGTGSVFVVSRAEERGDRNAQRYALKVPLYDAVAARAVSESEYLRVFKLEAGALLALPEHPNIAEFVTFDARARPKPLLVMELVEGVDCLALLRSGGLDMPRVVTILDGVLAGLSAMHEAGVGHLDVKPSNVVLRRGGEPVLVDFGLAGRHLRVGCATPYYASPEVWGHTDDGATPFTADVYSFACVAYELLTGEQLFEGNHVLAVMAAHFEHDGRPEKLERLAGKHPEVAAFLAQALRRSARERKSADAMRDELTRLAPRLRQLTWPLA